MGRISRRSTSSARQRSSRRSARSPAFRRCRPTTRSTSPCSCPPAHRRPAGGRSCSRRGRAIATRAHRLWPQPGHPRDRDDLDRSRRLRLRTARVTADQFADGTSFTIPDAGRSYDQDGNNLIATDEGTSAAGDRLWTVGPSDTHKQTVIDLLQLVRVIEVGMDVDGDGSADIDASRISFHGQSAGGRHGTMLAALDPSVNLVTLSGCCSTSPEYARWNVNQRSGLGRQLAARVPSLINADGLTSIDGVPIAPPYHNENKPLRNRPTVVNTVAGAIEIKRRSRRASGDSWPGRIRRTAGCLTSSGGRSPATRPRRSRSTFSRATRGGQSIRE